jgi:hypothetical protein
MCAYPRRRSKAATILAITALALGLTSVSATLSFSAEAPPTGMLLFPLPPFTNQGDPDAPQAIADKPTRADAVITFLACGKEVDFLNWVLDANDTGIITEDLGAVLIAKLAWLINHVKNYEDQELHGQKCEQTIRLAQDTPDQIAAAGNFLADHGATINQLAAGKIDRDCGQIVNHATLVDEPGFDADGKPTTKHPIEIGFTVTALCLRAQINKAVSRTTYSGQIGSSGFPCLSDVGSFIAPPIIPRPIGREGEADINVRDMTRIFYLSENSPKGGRRILSSDARTYMRDKLLIIHGPPGDATYWALGCGDTEHSTGTPQDLMDERDWLDDTVREFADPASWLVKYLALFALLGGSPALLALLGEGVAIPAAPILQTVIAGVASLAISETKAGETENHRLMIESSRYLKNQIILHEESDHPNIGKLQKDQMDLKAWLLSYMGEIMRHDFAEYNARPYQRYSLFALFNLTDFAEDLDVREGAGFVIEFALAKFALAGREGIRVVPYRRRVDAMNKNPWMLDLGGEGTDHPIAEMLLYTGQSQRLATLSTGSGEFQEVHKLLPTGTPGAMIYAASSSLMPAHPITRSRHQQEDPVFPAHASRRGRDLYQRTELHARCRRRTNKSGIDLAGRPGCDAAGQHGRSGNRGSYQPDPQWQRRCRPIALHALRGREEGRRRPRN